MAATESYRVAAALMLGGDFRQQLAGIIEDLEKADTAAREAQEAVDGLGRAFGEISRASRGVSAVGRALERLKTDRLQDLGAGVDLAGDAAGKAAEGFGRLADAVGRLSGAARSITAISRSLERMEGAAGGVERVGSAFDRLADNQVAMADRAAAMADSYRSIAASARDAAGGAGRVARAGGGHGDGLTSMDVTMAAVPVAAGGTEVLRSVGEAAMAPAYYRSMLLANGQNSPAAVDAGMSAAWAATQSAPGSTFGGNAEALSDISQITGDLKQATAVLPQFAELSAVLRAANFHSTGGDDPSFAAAKALEIMGRLTEETRGPDGQMHASISPERLTEYTAAMARIAVRSGGRVNPDDYLRYAKQARVGGMEMDDRFTFYQLPAILQVLGGSRTGTFVNSGNQVFSGGHIMDKTMQAFIDAGLADKGGLSEIVGRDGKKHTQVNADAIHDVALMRTNLVEWIRLETGRLSAEGKSRDAIFQVLQRLGQRSTIGGGWADIYANLPGIDREEAAIKATLKPGADGSDPLKSFLGGNPAANAQQFQAALTNLEAAFGSAAFPQAIGLMKSLTSALNGLGDWATKHPTEAKVITDVAAALTVLAAGIGAVSGAMLIYGPIWRAAAAMGGAKAAAGAGSGAASTAVAAGAGAAATRSGVRAVVSRAAGIVARRALGAIASGPGVVAEEVFSPSELGHDDLPNAPWLHRSAVPPASAMPSGSTGPVPVHVVNGSDLARGVTAAQARSLSGPSTSGSAFDSRVTPLMPGAGGLQ